MSNRQRSKLLHVRLPPEELVEPSEIFPEPATLANIVTVAVDAQPMGDGQSFETDEHAEAEGMLLREVGDHFGLTRERIRQIQDSALAKFCRSWEDATGERITASDAARLIRDMAIEDEARKEHQP